MIHQSDVSYSHPHPHMSIPAVRYITTVLVPNSFLSFTEQATRNDPELFVKVCDLTHSQQKRLEPLQEVAKAGFCVNVDTVRDARTTNAFFLDRPRNTVSTVPGSRDVRDIASTELVPTSLPVEQVDDLVDFLIARYCLKKIGERLAHSLEAVLG